MLKVFGAVLMVLGLIALVTGGFSFTRKEKVVDIGPIDVTREKTTSKAIPVAASVAALVAGGVMLFAGARR